MDGHYVSASSAPSTSNARVEHVSEDEQWITELVGNQNLLDETNNFLNENQMDDHYVGTSSAVTEELHPLWLERGQAEIIASDHGQTVLDVDSLPSINDLFDDGPLPSINELFDDDTPASQEPTQKKRKTIDDDDDE